jgi:membrane-bound lytic murein transglycosylase D
MIMIFRKILFAASLLLCLVQTAPAQDGFKSRKQLLRENLLLRQRIKDLEDEIEWYKNDINEKDSLRKELITIFQENENKVSEAFEPAPYTAEMTDSLLSVWYLHRENRQLGEVEPFNVDSVSFTTDVPDSVLINRLSRMNSFMTLPYNETVKNCMILYSEKMPRKMANMLGLCSYYMPVFEETFRAYNLPLELKYVAIIESALNPRAVSRVKATGMWQFMYATARSYGLEINSYVDERLDPFRSVDAAARYFRDAYNIFGDWSLAISSYNCGSGNVNKAIKRAGGRRDFWSIYEYLPRETRGYVPAMVGAMYAFRYANEYGIKPAPMSLPTYVDTFHIHKNLHFGQISEVLGIPLADVRDLNPQYYNDIVPGAHSDEVIRLPFNYSSSFLDMQDSIYRYKADVLFATKVEDGRETVNGRAVQTARPSATPQWVYYKVKSGDNLGKIAINYHTSVRQLKSWNNLRSDRIAIGQRLKVGKR